MSDKIYGRLGAIGRFRPLHEGAARMLESMCEAAEQVVIGVGSANKYNVRNPFTADEVEGMINAYLSPRFDNYRIVHIDDFAHIPAYSDGQRWRAEIVEKIGPLDAFVSGNDYVATLLKNDYQVMPSYTIVPEDKRIPIRGTMVRVAMAQGESWKQLVPDEVAAYITAHGLDTRFRTEFGLETLHKTSEKDIYNADNSETERQHTLEA